jgi:cyclohexa-1,5-dienecarbonyl-CoA hydratase
MKLAKALAHDGRVLSLSLDAPKANVLDSEMIGALGSAVAEAGRDRSISAIVLSGAGDHFSFGASVEEHQKAHAEAMLRRFHGLFRTLGETGIPTIAVVRGLCLGGGLELAAWATWIFAARTAVFGQPEIKLGVFPPMASLLLPWRIGGRGLDLCVSGRQIGADEAHRIGLVFDVSDDPSAAADAFIREHILPKSPGSLRFAERAARASLERILAAELPRLEAMYLDELMETFDANEGIAAFIEKRPPRFGGRS